MEIGEFSRTVGLPPSTLRYYERIGVLPAPARSGGRRVYQTRDVAAAMLLASARNLGFTVRDLQALAQTRFDVDSAKQAAARKAVALETRISQLSERRAALIALSTCDCVDPSRCARVQTTDG